MKKRRKRKAKEPIYYFCDLWMMNYEFFIGWSYEDFKEHMVKFHDHDPEFHPACAGKTILLESDDGNGTIIVWVANRRDHSSLAHEALHASNFTLARAGWIPDLDNDEPQAYLVGNIVEQALSG